MRSKVLGRCQQRREVRGHHSSKSKQIYSYVMPRYFEIHDFDRTTLFVVDYKITTLFAGAS